MAVEKMTHVDNLPKHKPSYAFLAPLVGKLGLILIDGEYWRKIRKMYSYGFASGNVETQIPGMIEEVDVFTKALERVANTGQLVKLSHYLVVTFRQ
jgi:cytochrome P450